MGIRYVMYTAGVLQNNVGECSANYDERDLNDDGVLTCGTGLDEDLLALLPQFL